jgi:hypothetical protein
VAADLQATALKSTPSVASARVFRLSSSVMGFPAIGQAFPKVRTGAAMVEAPGRHTPQSAVW